MGNQAQNKKKHFHLFQIPMLKKPDFNVKLKLLIHFNFSQFHEHIFKSSCSQIFFKLCALKNFAILKIEKRLQHRCFPVTSSH